MNNMPVRPEDLIAHPAWLPHALDMERRVIRFAKIDRQALAREAFLDGRMAGSVKAVAEAPISSLLSAAKEQRVLPSFIFHTAFCCSTLLARALDAPGQSLALKEPEILMTLANAYRMAKSGADRRDVDEARDLILNLLSRPHQGDERVLIKPTNTANNLAPIIAKTNAPVIFLYSDLKGFLISVLKKGEACKAFVRKQYVIFALDKEGVDAIPQRDALKLTDLQIAALVWRHQMEMFVRLLAAPNADNLRSLDFRLLLDKPLDVLSAANAHLKLNIKQSDLEIAAVGPVFQKDSKSQDQQYDAGARAKDEAELMSRHEEELSLIEAWAKDVKLSIALPAAMPRPLL